MVLSATVEIRLVSFKTVYGSEVFIALQHGIEPRPLFLFSHRHSLYRVHPLYSFKAIIVAAPQLDCWRRSIVGDN